MNDLRGDQIMYFVGDIPSYSPSLKSQARDGGAVWADAGTIVPWNIYLNYGVKNLLKKFYPMMRDYIVVLINKDLEQGNYHLMLDGFTYGDWLAQDGENDNSRFGGTDHIFIKSVYYYHSVDLVTLAAKELEYNFDYMKYTKIKNDIYKAILNEYFTNDGKLILNTQTSFVLCLKYKIYKNKGIIIEDFKERIKNDLYHLKTGFTGTPLLLLVLFDNDMDDIAYRILYNENYPGWLFSINLGATTIWERWNSMLENGTVNESGMNSFNHYAYGSVCEAIYSRIAGLRNLAPGWKRVMIKPHLNYRMKKMKFSYESVNGKYDIFWEWKDNKFNMNVTIPYGVIAIISLPDGNVTNVRDGGNYYFECELNKKIYSPFSVDIPMIDIIKNNGSAEIIKRHLPKLYEKINNNNDNEIIKYSIRNASSLYNFNYPQDIIEKCNEELIQFKP